MVVTRHDPTRLLEAAQSGNEATFDQLVSPYRGELLAHCYRMLGSYHDADDALQDALLRSWRGLPGFDGRSSFRSWMFAIATNASLDAIKRRSRHRALPLDRVPATDPADLAGVPLIDAASWIEPYPDLLLDTATPEADYEVRESVELAFIAVLQHLPARQRAVLILRDVLGFSAQEVAGFLQTTPVSVKSALQRARRTLRQRLPETSQQSTLKAVGDARVRELVGRYTRAMEDGNVEAVVALLTEDAVWSMPPFAAWFVGHDPIREFLRTGPMMAQWRHLSARANGQVAIGWYRWQPERGLHVAFALEVLSLRDTRIAAVTAFVNGDLLADFGLPAHV